MVPSVPSKNLLGRRVPAELVNHTRLPDSTDGYVYIVWSLDTEESTTTTSQTKGWWLTTSVRNKSYVEWGPRWFGSHLKSPDSRALTNDLSIPGLYTKVDGTYLHGGGWCNPLSPTIVRMLCFPFLRRFNVYIFSYVFSTGDTGKKEQICCTALRHSSDSPLSSPMVPSINGNPLAHHLPGGNRNCCCCCCTAWAFEKPRRFTQDPQSGLLLQESNRSITYRGGR